MCKTQTTYPQYVTPIDVIIRFIMRFFYSETSIKIGHVNETSILLEILFDHLTKDMAYFESRYLHFQIGRHENT